ncbi:uncharacterized protein B0J16DRAFT_378838 [Fusarium flagelliforme]|uniref:Uncharacterized protein n=1 Tax=Fusarium flagelliforme TaxID=2675880 RepID=A0A395N5Z6_9HYPO|nr:uncharacterized protein B0J16DRAFT_378838 [Fusarium flagelliforme]KAH7198400.1 hypothetical protein B0J16DRAFT_378838 [Fusarium flagelliforme]RFN55203.1 hypothetical protein FIE12Z_456 [Fusarium flagelliforme]
MSSVDNSEISEPPTRRLRSGRVQKRQMPAKEDDEDEDSESSVQETAPKKRGPGRPKGSANNRKLSKAEQTRKKGAKRENLERHRDFATRHPMITADQLPQIIGPLQTPPFDANWTEADEDHQKQIWSEALEAISNLDPTNHSRLITTWKLCYRLYKTSPFGLFSPMRGLCYLPNSEEHSQTSSVLWNIKFCEDLNRILTHRAWMGNVDVVVTLLQYAVICRTDDRRVWQMPNIPIEGGPLVRLRATLQSLQGPLPVSIRKLHREARAESPQLILCPLSNLMREIAITVRKSQDSSKASQIFSCNEFLVCAVSPVDVRNILTAIDNSTLTNTEDKYRHFLDHRKTNQDMPNKKQLPEHMRSALLHEAREMDKQKGLNGRAESGTAVAAHTAPLRDRDEYEAVAEEAPGTLVEPVVIRSSSPGTDNVDDQLGDDFFDDIPDDFMMEDLADHAPGNMPQQVLESEPAQAQELEPGFVRPLSSSSTDEEQITVGGEDVSGETPRDYVLHNQGTSAEDVSPPPREPACEDIFSPPTTGVFGIAELMGFSKLPKLEKGSIALGESLIRGSDEKLKASSH